MAAIKEINERDRVDVPGTGILNNVFVRAGEYNKLVKRVNSIATEDGVLDMTSIQVNDGTAAAPTITFDDDTNLGFYRVSADVMGFTAAGVGQVNFHDGSIRPVTTNDIDLGTVARKFKDAFVEGNITTGTLVIGTLLTNGSTTGITAFAGGGQTDAVALTTTDNNVTVCATAGDSVKLPAAVAGITVSVKNSGATALDIFPATGDSIDALAVNLAIRIAPSATATFRAINTTVWESDVDASINLVAPTSNTGQLVITAASSAGNTVTTITNASQAATRIYTVPDAGADASFVMSEGAQSIAGVKTFSDATDSTTKDTGSVILEGGLGVEKAIFSGSTIDATTDFTVGNTVITSGAVTATSGSLTISMGTPSVGTGFDGAAVAKWIPYGTFGAAGPKVTEFIFDLTNLVNSTTVNDIIGETATANCYMGQITAAVHGTVFAMEITCLETPAGGDPDIDFYSATEATGTENDLVTDLTETLLLARGASWAIDDRKSVVTALPAADQYLYLAVGSAGGAPGTYTAGKFKIRFYGV